jgi:hypothetical protein
MSSDGTYKGIERNGDEPPLNIQVKLFDIRQTNK